MGERHYTDRHADILDDVPMKAAGEAPGWVDNPSNVKKVVWAVYLISGAVLVIDPLVHKHGPFAIEHLWGFYGIYGFIGCVFLVLAAKEMRKFLIRSEDYYARKEKEDG